MKKFLLLWSILALIGFTFASESFPAFPMTIYWNTNLAWWTLKVYDWSNYEISSYEITSAGKYWSENAFVLPLSLNSFEGGLSFKAIYNWQEYALESIDDSKRWEWCPSKNSITFVSENCRYDLVFIEQSNDYKIWLKKDKCPGGDFSDSYYDWKCGESTKTTHGSANIDGVKSPYQRWEELKYDTLKYNPKYSDEMNKAYQYAYYYGITTKWSIKEADMNWNLTRVAMAKMLSQYAINVLWKQPDKTRQKTFTDVSSKLDTDYDNGVTLAYQLWIMWIWIDNFRPYDTVTRAEFGTALSRMLFNIKDWKDKYYSTHLSKLKQEWIITNDDPTLKELRWYVMLMLMRSAK